MTDSPSVPGASGGKASGSAHREPELGERSRRKAPGTMNELTRGDGPGTVNEVPRERRAWKGSRDSLLFKGLNG